MSEEVTTSTPMTVNDAPNYEAGHISVNDPEGEDPFEGAMKRVEEKATKEPVAPKIEEKKEEPKLEKRKKKVVVDKKEIELELDDETETKLFQKALAADKRLSEAAKERKELEAFAQKVQSQAQKIEEFLEDLEKDPRKVLLSRLGPQKFREIAEPLLAEELKREMMDPKERALLEERAKREELEAKIQAQEQEQENKKAEALKTQYAQQYQGLIIKGIEQHGLPKTPGAIKAFAGYMQKAIQREQPIDDTLLGRIAEIVREDNITGIKELISGFHDMAKKAEEAKDTNSLVKIGDELRELFGEDIVNLIRRSDLARLRSTQPQMPKPVLETPRTKPVEEPVKRYLSEDEYQEERRKRAREFDEANAHSVAR